MNASYPAPFSMRRSACRTASWSFALGSNECGSWPADEMIDVPIVVRAQQTLAREDAIARAEAKKSGA